MDSKEYLEARKEFWNCIRMTPFTLGISLIMAFVVWKPMMDAAARPKSAVQPHRLQTQS